MLSGVAVARAVDNLAPNKGVQLKWPNDVMVNGRKLAGILIEAARGAFIIGIGLNVKPPGSANDLTKIATSLVELGRAMDRLRVIEAIIFELDFVLRSSTTEGILNEWRAFATLGQTQTFEQHGQRITGEVLDLDPDHGLIVRRDTGEIVTLPAATTSVVS